MMPAHKRNPLSIWQRKLTLLLGFFLAAILVLFAAWSVLLFVDQIDIDQCLDSGGSWNDQTSKCEYGTDSG